MSDFENNRHTLGSKTTQAVQEKADRDAERRKNLLVAAAVIFAVAVLILSVLGVAYFFAGQNDSDLGISDSDLGISDSDFVIENGVLTKYNGTDADVVIPDGVTAIGVGAFRECYNLERITIPDSVISIEDNAFRECVNLREIVIPESVTSIGYFAFSDCVSLKSAIIPSSVTYVAAGAFAGCSDMQAIYCEAKEKPTEWANSWCGEYSDEVVWNYLADFVIEDGVLTKYNGNYEYVIIPDSVTSIGRYAFQNCYSLTSITIPDSVTSIGRSAFAYCTSLTSIIIPDSVTSIDRSAFAYCTSLTSIIIPDSVTSIDRSAFYNCDNLKTIYCEAAAKPADWDNNWKYSCSAKVVWGYKAS